MEELLSPRELADYLGVPPRTIDDWRYRGLGPPSLRVGKHVRYRSADVERWLAGRAAAQPRAVTR